MSDVDNVKAAIKGQENALMKAEVRRDEWLSSGSTLLNLASSGTPYGAFAKGRYFWVVGDSSSGKTFLTLTAFAEASINPSFDNYDFIFDNVEDGALMNFEKFFGKRMASRIQPPRSKNGMPVFSRTIEDFYYILDDRLKAVEAGKAKPFLYLLDSMDALSSKYEGEKFGKKKKAAREGEKAAGDYGDGKAKLNSTYIRTMVARLRDTGCMMIILSQTRDKINAGMFDPEKQTAAGGRALKFYAAWQMWSSVGRELSKEVNGTKRQIGIVSRLRIRKNRLTGKNWTVEVPIYWSVGFDDIGSLVDFLVAEKHWTGGDEGKKGICAPELDFEGPRIKLIRHIEENNMELDLRSIVTDVWKEVEEACVVQRKRRYE